MTFTHVLIRGRVQGVGFRWFVREHAQRLGLTGWVTNRDDGSVEVVAEGRRDAIDEFLLLLRRGSPGSQVSAIDAISEAGGCAFEPGFMILR